MNSTGPPGAGNPHARWDEGAPEEIDQAEILRHCQSKEAAPATAQLPPVSSGLYSTSSGILRSFRSLCNRPQQLSEL